MGSLSCSLRGSALSIFLFFIFVSFFVGSLNCDPIECPQHVGAPCPRYYNNTMPDYEPGTPVVISNDALQQMKIKRGAFMAYLVANFPPNSDLYFDAYVGSTGRAMVFLRMWKHESNSTLKNRYLTLAQSYINAALGYLNANPPDPSLISFFRSYIGVYCVGSILSFIQGNLTQAQFYITAVQDAINNYSLRSCSDPQVTWNYDDGVAGLAYAGWYLNSFFNNSAITYESMLNLALFTIRCGVERSSQVDHKYLYWIKPIGQGDGMFGILYHIMTYPEIVSNKFYKKWIVKTMDYISSQLEPDGRWPDPGEPYNYGGSDPFNTVRGILVQWDHGSPGFMALALMAWKALGDEKYLHQAELASNYTWKYGILTKGLMNCHGISGNTYMFILMYQATGDLRYLYRAIKFQEYVVSTPIISDIKQMRKPTPFELVGAYWVGSIAPQIALWTDYISEPDPKKWCLTGWQLPGCI